MTALLVATLAALVSAGPVAAADELDAVGVDLRTVRTGASVAHVASFGPDAPVVLRAMVAGDRVGSGLERTSAMCRRAGCLVAVNGDFRLPGTTRPVGGFIRSGVVEKSPTPHHHQLLIGPDGSLEAGPVSFGGRLVSSDLETVVIDAVNDERRDDSVVLYTPAHGRRTGTNDHGVEMVLAGDGAATPALGSTVALLLRERAPTGSTPIPAHGAVLSGHGRGAERLERLLNRAAAGDIGPRVLLRLEATPAAHDSVGGTPILLRDGRRWFADEAANFVRGRHPRTAVGWNERGETFLVAVDGRQPGYSEGMSLAELADFLLELGVTDALNLDGGGTTTFVRSGEVMNRPSDRLVQRDGAERIVNVPAAGDVVRGSVERPSTTALVVVPRDAPRVDDPLAGNPLDLPAPVDLPPPTGADPASVPGGALPALVGVTARPPLDPRWAALAIATLVVSSLGVGLARRGRERHARREVTPH